MAVLLVSVSQAGLFYDVMLEPSFSLAVIFVNPLGNASLAPPGRFRLRRRRRRRLRRLAVQDEMMRREFVARRRTDTARTT